MSIINSKVGKMIRSHRHFSGLSIEALAFEADITPNFLGDVERGKKNVSRYTVM